MNDDEAWDRFVEAGNKMMAYMEADTAVMAERLGVTVEDLGYFARTLNYEWLAARIPPEVAARLLGSRPEAT